MSYLPLYIDTSGKKCLIIGGGKVASRKLVPILKSKMHVTMISPEIHNENYAFETQTQQSTPFLHERREWSADSFNTRRAAKSLQP